MISNSPAAFTVLQDELLTLYQLQVSVALHNWFWMLEKQETLHQVTESRWFPNGKVQTTPASHVSISDARSFRNFRLLSIALVTAECRRARWEEKISNRLMETNWRLQPGPLFIEVVHTGRDQTLLVRNSNDENDQMYRKYVLIASDVAMGIKTNEGLLRWASRHFCELAARPLSMIMGLGSNQIWPDKYGEIIFGHDLEVAQRHEALCYFESLWDQSRNTLSARFAIRFPLGIPTDNVERIAVVGFNPFRRNVA